MENKVHAFAVDDVHITVCCPHHRRKTFHRHGSCGNLLNREEHRSSHCEHMGDYTIVIDDDTIRGTVRNNRILKRSCKILDKVHAKQIKKANK